MATMSRSFTNHGSSRSTAATCGMFAAATATFCSTAALAMSACAAMFGWWPAGRSSASRATPISTISAAIMSSTTAVCTVSEAAILADPRHEWTLADRYATDQMFDRLPPGWDAAAYRIRPAPATVLLRHGDRIDLGDRAFEVIHTPGHSPGGIALFEAEDRHPAVRRCRSMTVR